jgi:DNA-binding NarL/FixJ family response regulator
VREEDAGSVRVVLADDHALVRAGFRALLERTDGIEVVGEAGDGVEAVALVRATRPDVVLMDVRMPVMDGIEATRQITGAAAPGGAPGQITGAEPSAGPRVLILTTFDLDEYVYAALRAGASGFLLKDTMPADLLSAIRVIAAGDALLAPSVTRRLLGEFARRPDLRAPRSRPPVLEMNGLTDREREVLRLVAGGMSNGEIAGRLCISPATAKTHVAHLLTKLNCRDRIQLVILAYQAGLVTA